MKYGLIGEKLGHSFSKEIHEKISDYTYEICEIPKDEINEFMEERKFSGINVTIPYKETVIPYIDEIDESAKKIGAVNTIVNKNGKLYGYNTDYAGASALIRHADIEISSKKVLILGTGGTSKTLSAVCTDLGAKDVIKVSREKKDGIISYDEAQSLHSDAEIIVNTTPVGMYPNSNGCPINIDLFEKLEGVVDVIYNPLKTELVCRAEKKSVKACGGLYMLVAQAVYASAYFTGNAADDSLIEKIYTEILKNKQNTVLIGMPSCGKSSVGKRLSELTSREFIDSDEEIIKSAQKSIAQIFNEVGENGFRKLEKEVICELSKKNGVIISTGGGAVLDCENVKRLSQNGVIFFIDRSLEKLITTDDRPLSRDTLSLKKLYDTRYPIYVKSAHITINGDGTVDDVTEEIMRKI